MKLKVKDLKGSGVPVIFGPASNPDKFKIDLLEEARRRLSLGTINFNELELEIGDRLEDKPYSDTSRAKRGMPPTYLYEGSVWVNLYSSDGRWANISLVPHMHEAIPPHHNFWLYWTNFDWSEDSDNRILGHRIPVGEPISVRISYCEETRKGIIKIKGYS